MEASSLRMMKQNAMEQSSAQGIRGLSQQFEFINLLNKPQLTDIGTKKTVRAHAMRDFRRRRGESHHSRRATESSVIKAPDASKPSPNIESDLDGLVLDRPIWMRSMDADDDSSLLLNSPCDMDDTQPFMPQERKENAMNSRYRSFSESAADGNDSTSCRDEYAVKYLPPRPRKRKKTEDHEASSGTLSEDGNVSQNPLGSQVENKMILASPRMNELLGAGSYDPFNALPIACNRRMHILVHHYISVFVRCGNQLIPRETWIKEALKDSALFQATLLPAAAHYALLYDLDLAESFQLFGQTTQMLHQRLSDPEQGSSDATLAAVICLSFVERVLGNISASIVHLEGLQRMVELRGGLHALGFGGVLQRMVLWADNWTGILALSPPRFPLVEKFNNHSKYSTKHLNISRPKSASQNGYSASLASADTGKNQDDLFGILFRLQQLTRTLADIHAHKTTLTEAVMYNDGVFLLERQLLLSLVSGEQPHGSPLEIFILQSFTHAAYIYLYSTLHSTLRDLPLKSPFFGIFVERLHTALDHPEFFSTWCSASPVMLLWVLVVGGIASYRRPQRAWFMIQLTSVCFNLKISDSKSLRGLLQETMWVDGALDSSLSTLWSELCMLTMSSYPPAYEFPLV